MKRRLLASFIVTTLTFGFLAFGFFGSATSIAQSGLARSFGASIELVTGAGATSLVAPLPSVSADKANPQAEQALLRIADVPAGPTSLIDEIAALYVTGRVNVDSETAIATSDTARVALLETLDTPAALPGLDLNDVLGLVGSIGNISNIKLAAPLASSPSVVADALHGIVTLSCPQLETLRSSTTLQRLQAITQGSLAQQVKIKPILNLDTTNTELPVVGNINKLNVDLGGSNGTERAAAYHLRIDLPAIDALGIKAGTRLLELSIYEVTGENLQATNLKEATVRTAVDMLHVTVLDKITGLPEVNVRVGHAEAALVGCGAAVPTTTSVPVTKIVSSIGGTPATSQIGLTAKPGDEVVYSLRVDNLSTADCGITHMLDQLPTGFDYISDSGDLGSGSFHSDTNRITWANFNLRKGQSGTQSVHVRVSPTIPTGVYVNRATASGSCGSFDGSAPGIEVLGRITVGVVKTIESIAGNVPSTTKALTAKAGNEVVYKLSVSNTSEESCTISQVVDQLPPGFLLTSTAGELGPGTYDSVANTVTWDGLEIAPGETSEQGLVIKLAPTIRPGTYRNTAQATGSCGTFNGSSDAITVPGVLGNRITRPSGLPRTGINDQLMWFGPLLLAGAAAGVGVLRRR